MITIEQLEASLGENKQAFQTRDIDHDVKAVTLLRERIPYEVCRSIIVAARHDVIYLPDIDKVLPYLTEEDLVIIADCNLYIDTEFDCLGLFI